MRYPCTGGGRGVLWLRSEGRNDGRSCLENGSGDERTPLEDRKDPPHAPVPHHLTQGSGFRVQDSGLGFRVQGAGLRFRH